MDKPFDELYRYDQVNRLIDFERGRLNEPNTAMVGTLSKEQAWDLDATGNWSHFTSATDGALETDQTRLHNEANEITQMSSWFPPAYDHAGNMVKMPKPAEPSEGFVCTYDAWNRLVRVAEADECGCAGELVSEYQYDGQTWRTMAVTYEDGSPSETRHFYYSSEWQILEERVGSLLTPERTHLWGLRYIDEIIHRWRDADANGTLDESLWALQDANWNVTGIYASSAEIQRAVYDAYGSRSLRASSYMLSEEVSDFAVGFSGYSFARAAGFWIARFRFMHSLAGSWATRDPWELGSMPNLYGYVSQRPTVSTDYLGLQPFDLPPASDLLQELNVVPGGTCRIAIFGGHNFQADQFIGSLEDPAIGLPPNLFIGVVACNAQQINTAIPKPNQMPGAFGHVDVCSFMQAVGTLRRMFKSAQGVAKRLCRQRRDDTPPFGDGYKRCCNSVRITVDCSQVMIDALDKHALEVDWIRKICNVAEPVLNGDTQTLFDCRPPERHCCVAPM